MEEYPEKFIYEINISCSDDILEARNKVQEVAQLRGFKKSQVTVLKTAISEVYRIFLDSDAMEEINTSIRNMNKADWQGICIQVAGKLPDDNHSEQNQNLSPEEVMGRFDLQFKKIKSVFSDYDLSVNGSADINLCLKIREPQTHIRD